MKRCLLMAVVAGTLPLAAQTTPVSPVSDVEAFAVRAPDEASPFFIDSRRARSVAAATAGIAAESQPVTDFPRNRGSDNSAGAQIRSFFTGMFSSVNLGPIRGEPVTSSLTVEPNRFSLNERREVTATYTIRNNTRRIMRLEYPTGQRIDIFTHDPSGAVIDKWSDDRSFDEQEGLVVINPRERIEYQERIPTREMKPGQTYRVDAFSTSAGDENFLSQQTVTPE
ncbi:MAG: BsuPI-related putative proteinase inhibitor [Terrimicrobiaceae bacterium]|nr:BsuPI-related putative proteinase inhibitor [Terrimicrobiaceae bacterium]